MLASAIIRHQTSESMLLRMDCSTNARPIMIGDRVFDSGDLIVFVRAYDASHAKLDFCLRKIVPWAAEPNAWLPIGRQLNGVDTAPSST